jgi:hypothetical protein
MDILDRLAGEVVTAAELGRAGVDHNAIVRLRRGGRLVRLYHRTYAVPPVTTGEFALACRGALAYAGAGARLVGETALAAGSTYPAPARPEVGVPRERHVRTTTGLLVRRMAGEWLAAATVRGGLAAQDPAVAVVWAWGRLARAADRQAVVCAAGVPPGRIRYALGRLPQVKDRAGLLVTCDHVEMGCASPGEIAYLVEVERAFGLPHGERQAVIEVPGQRVRRVDVRYGRVIVEIDGGQHDTTEDAVRDVVLTALGYHVVRITYTEIRRAPGLVAATVARALAVHS